MAKLSLCTSINKLLTANEKVFSGISAGQGYIINAGVNTGIEYKQLESAHLKTLIIESQACQNHALGNMSQATYEKVILAALAPQEIIEALAPDLMNEVKKDHPEIALASELKRAAGLDPNHSAVPDHSLTALSAAEAAQNAALRDFARISLQPDAPTIPLLLEEQRQILTRLTAIESKLPIAMTPAAQPMLACFSMIRRRMDKDVEIEFKTGSDELSLVAEQTLSDQIPHFSPGLSVDVAGFADRYGSWRINQALSYARARRVKQWVQIRKGYPALAVCDSGYGAGYINRRLARITVFQD